MSGKDDTQLDAEEVQKYLQAALCISSVTHDVNNYLGAIMAYTELIAIQTTHSPDAQRMSTEIIASLEKSTDLLTTLTDMVRLDETRVASIDIALVLEQVANLFQHDMKRAHITCEVDIQGDRSPLRVSRGKILRVITHLFRDCVQRTLQAQAKEIKVQFVGSAEEIVICIRDLSGIDPGTQSDSMNPLPGSLDMGMDAIEEKVHFHNGNISYDAAKGFILTLPRDTGL